jgi:fucose permease
MYLLTSILFAFSAFGGGFLTERIGRRSVLMLGAVSGALGLLASAASPVWALFLAANVLVSWGSGFVDAGVNGLFLDIYRDARGSSLNFLHLFFSLGSLIAPVLIGTLVSAGLHWRAVLVVTAVGFLLLLLPLATAGMPSGRHAARAPDAAANESSRAEASMLPFVLLAIGIALYAGAEVGVSNWLVRFLASVPLAQATVVLSLFWAGHAVGRLLSRWVAERLDYFAFTVACTLLASASLAAAVIVPWYPLVAALFALSGLFYGPVYPMIMALGGNIYPHRLSALSGSLTTAAAVGVIVYPASMGFLASQIGLRGGMIGAALLGLPTAAAIIIARKISVTR